MHSKQNVQMGSLFLEAIEEKDVQLMLSQSLISVGKDGYLDKTQGGPNTQTERRWKVREV